MVLSPTSAGRISSHDILQQELRPSPFTRKTCDGPLSSFMMFVYQNLLDKKWSAMF